MLKKIILSLALIISAFVSGNTNAYCANITNIQKEQAALSTSLKDADLNTLIKSSEFDLYYDMKLYYNPTVRELINKINKAEQHFEKSNVAVSYYEYKHILQDMQPNDFYYMFLAYKLSQFGFFSLAHEAMSKIEDREIWQTHTEAIRKHYFPKTTLKIPEEVFFAELLADIIYNNMTDESLNKLEKAERLLANSDYASYIRSKAYYTEKNYKKALEEINKALSQNEKNVNYITFKAEILSILNKNKEALHTLEQINKNEIIFTETNKNIEKVKYYTLSATEKNDNEKKYNLAYYFYLNQDYNRAINELNSLILKGDNKKAPELLGYIYKITNQNEYAEEIYDKSIVKNPKNAFAHKGKGDILIISKKYKEALEEYKLAQKYDKNNLDINIALAVTYYQTGDKKNAEKYLEKAKKVNQNNYKVLYLCSKLKNDIGKQYLKLSIRYNPFYPEGWLDLAETALTTKDTVSAEKYINTAAFITKNSPRYFYYKSILNTEKGSLETAQKDINRAKQLTTVEKREYDKI